MTSTAANKIIAARAFTTVAQVAAVSGVGTATMTALHSYAVGGDWGAPAACIPRFDDAVGPHLGDLLFLSESDRPFDLVAFPGAGSSAPTPASFLALIGAPAGSTVLVRSVDDYYVAFEPNSANSDPNAGADIQAAFAAQLTDVSYFAVVPPADSIDHSLVDVYLVGRTACGDLVGIHAVAVET
jgi:hypothetical protein